MPTWLIVWAFFSISFVAIGGACLGLGYLIGVARRANELCTREHTDEVAPDELMRRVGIRDHRGHSRSSATPRTFAPGRHPVAHLRDPLSTPTRTMPRVDEEVAA